MAKAGRGDDQYMVRFPPGLRDRIKEVATANGWSMNNEIIDRLEASLESWPHLSLLPVIRRRASLFGEEEKLAYERALNRTALQLALECFPINATKVSSLYSDLSGLISSLEISSRQELDEKARDLIEGLIDALPEKEREVARGSYDLIPRPPLSEVD